MFLCIFLLAPRLAKTETTLEEASKQWDLAFHNLINNGRTESNMQEFNRVLSVYRLVRLKHPPTDIIEAGNHWAVLFTSLQFYSLDPTSALAIEEHQAHQIYKQFERERDERIRVRLDMYLFLTLSLLLAVLVAVIKT